MQSTRTLAAIVASAILLGGLTGAIGISGDGIDQDDLVSRTVAVEHFLPTVPNSEGGPLFGVQ
jgi:hypothetical protein